MGIIALVCPQCGAKISLDDTREFGFCSFCGTKMMFERAGHIIYSIDRTKEAENYLLRAKDFFENYDYDNAELYANKVLDIDFSNEEAKLLLNNSKRALRGNNLTVTMKKHFFKSNSKLLIVLDGKPVAVITEGGQWTGRILEGKHELYIKTIFKRQSNVIVFNADRYSAYNFETSSGSKITLKEL